MKNLLFLLTFSLMLGACAGSTEDHDHYPSHAASDRAETPEMATNDEFLTSFTLALDAYFDLKDALVKTDAENAAQHAEILHSRLELVEFGDLPEQASVLWADAGTQATESANSIVSESDVEEQRVQFEHVSNVFINMVKAYGPFENTIYRQTCPMVRGGSADWLSREENVMNPYHGDRMLNCGSVVERI